MTSSNDTSAERVSIDVHAVSGAEVGQAVDRVEQLLAKYRVEREDADSLFNAMVAMFVRQRMVYGDRTPTPCSLADCMGDGD